MADDKELLIIDSSVIIKWLTDEKEDLAEALLIKDRYKNKQLRILVPLLVHWEVSNHLGRNYSPEAAAAQYSHFLLIRLEQTLLNVAEAKTAFEIMKKTAGVSYYDASFHALALHRQGIFVTSDKKYFDKAKSLGKIKLLKEYK